MGEKFFFWFMDWILDRLDEASTWRAFILVLGAIGIQIKPEAQQLIIQAGVLFFGGSHFMPDQLQYFEKFKSASGTSNDLPVQPSNKQLTSKERSERFSKEFERAAQAPAGVQTESRIETGVSSSEQKESGGKPNDTLGSGWNG